MFLSVSPRLLHVDLRLHLRWSGSEGRLPESFGGLVALELLRPVFLAFADLPQSIFVGQERRRIQFIVLQVFDYLRKKYR